MCTAEQSSQLAPHVICFSRFVSRFLITFLTAHINLYCSHSPFLAIPTKATPYGFCKIKQCGDIQSLSSLKWSKVTETRSYLIDEQSKSV